MYSIEASIIQQVIDTLGGTPVFGTVDEDNNIILTGALADGTYTLKYEDAEGNVTTIGTLDFASTVVVALTFTKGKIDSSTGEISGDGTNNTYFYSNMVTVESGHSYSVHCPAGLSATAKAVFWDADDSFMSSASCNLWNDASATGTTSEADYAITIPDGAASFRIRVYNFAYSSADAASASLAAVQEGVVLTKTVVSG